VSDDALLLEGIYWRESSADIPILRPIGAGKRKANHDDGSEGNKRMKPEFD
jgi:hypothetical protein